MGIAISLRKRFARSSPERREGATLNSGEPRFGFRPCALQKCWHVRRSGHSQRVAGRSAQHHSASHLCRVARRRNRVVLRAEKVVRIIVEQNCLYAKRLGIFVIARPPIRLDVVVKLIVRSRRSENRIEESNRWRGGKKSRVAYRNCVLGSNFLHERLYNVVDE